MSELETFIGASGATYTGTYDEDGHVLLLDEDGDLVYPDEDFDDFGADVGFEGDDGQREFYGDGTGDPDWTAEAVLADNQADLELAQGRAEQAAFDYETTMFARQVTAALEKRGADPNSLDVQKLHDVHAGLLRGVRPGDQRAEERAFDLALAAALPAKDELEAAAQFTTRREAESEEVKASSFEALAAEGFDPVTARLAIERAADLDGRPLPGPEPDEVETAETWHARQEVEA